MGHDTNLLPRHFCRLIKTIDSFSNHQAKITNYEDNMEEFELQITPTDGAYRGGQFKFSVRTTDYPNVAPSINCKTKIYHPNMDGYDGVCMSLLDDWQASNDLEDLVQGLLFLFYNPNLEDPLSSLFEEESEEEYEYGSFEENVRASLEGKTVAGENFQRVLFENEDTQSKEPKNIKDIIIKDNMKKCGKEIDFEVVNIYMPDMSVAWLRVRPATG